MQKVFCNWLYSTCAGTELFGALKSVSELTCWLEMQANTWLHPLNVPLACSNLELLWLKSGANKRAPFGRNRKRGRGWPLFRLSPVGLEELLTVWTQTSTWGETFLQAELLPGGAQQTQTPWSCPFPRGPPSPFVQRKAGTPGWKQSCRKWGAGAFYSFPKSTAVLLHVLTYDTLARTVPFTTRGGRTWL